MLETPEEMENLQALLDGSMASAGPHLRDVITDERRLTAEQLTQRLQGMRLLVLATVTADGRPSPGRSTATSCTAPSGSALRPARCGGATWPGGPPAVPPTSRGTSSAVTVHGHGGGPPPSTTRRTPTCCRPCSTSTSPRWDPEFEQGLEAMDAVGVRIVPEKMFTFSMAQ